MGNRLCHKLGVAVSVFDFHNIDVDYFAHAESDAVSLVEWGDKFYDTYIDADVELRFTRCSDQERTIALYPLSPRGKELVECLSEGKDVFCEESEELSEGDIFKSDTQEGGSHV